MMRTAISEAEAERVGQLLQLKHSDGWKIVEAEIRDRMDVAREKLENLMDARPEALTNRTAFRHAMKRRALSELLSWLDAEIARGGPHG
jgi:hypothetical protein